MNDICDEAMSELADKFARLAGIDQSQDCQRKLVSAWMKEENVWGILHRLCKQVEEEAAQKASKPCQK